MKWKKLLSILLTLLVLLVLAYWLLGGFRSPLIEKVSLQHTYFAYRTFLGHINDKGFVQLRDSVRHEWQSKPLKAWAAYFPFEPTSAEDELQVKLGVILYEAPQALPNTQYKVDTLQGDFLQVTVRTLPWLAPRPYKLHEQAREWASRHAIVLNGAFWEMWLSKPEKIVILYQIE